MSIGVLINPSDYWMCIGVLKNLIGPLDEYRGSNQSIGLLDVHQGLKLSNRAI